MLISLLWPAHCLLCNPPLPQLFCSMLLLNLGHFSVVIDACSACEGSRVCPPNRPFHGRAWGTQTSSVRLAKFKSFHTANTWEVCGPERERCTLLLTNRNTLAQCPVSNYLRRHHEQTRCNRQTIARALSLAGRALASRYLCPCVTHVGSLSICYAHTDTHGWEGYFQNAIAYRLRTVSSLTVIIAKLCVSLTVTSGWRLSLRLNPTWFDWIPSFLDFLVVFFIISSI